MSAGNEIKRHLGVGMPGPRHTMADMTFSVRRVAPPESIADPELREHECLIRATDSDLESGVAERT